MPQGGVTFVLELDHNLNFSKNSKSKDLRTTSTI